MEVQSSALCKGDDPADVENGAAAGREEFVFEPAKAYKSPSYAARIRYIFLPEIMQRRGAQASKLRSTAYLDGLRGLAAFVVYLAHNLLSANHLFTPLEVAFGYEGKNRNLVNFPFLRLLFTGSHVAVPLFFVISGYVQARKPIQQIVERQDVSGTLASAIVRRPFRLYIPVIGSTLAFTLIWHIFGITPALNHHEPTILADLSHYLCELWHWTYIFRSKNKGYFTDHGKVREAWFDYNGHTWTIPIEIQGSIILYLFLLTLCKVPARTRAWTTAIAAIYFLVHGSCYTFTFLAGSVIAELEYLTASRADLFISARNPYRKHVFYALLVMGCYLGAPPAVGLIYMSSEMLAQQPGFGWIAKFVPWVYYDTIHFLVSIASIMILLPIMAMPQLQRLFEGRVLQYLGRISFSLYLVHGPMIETLGTVMYALVGKTVPTDNALASPWQDFMPVPKIGPLGIDLPFIVANMVILPATLYAAEICMRVFDENSIWISRMAYTKLVGTA